MKNTIKTIAIATSLCSALLVSTVSYADSEATTTVQVEENKNKHQKMQEKRFAKLADKLDLTEAQQVEIKALKADERVQMDAYKAAMKAFKDQRKALVSAETFDEQAFIELQASNQDVFAAIELIKVKSHVAMRKILTEEQLVKFEKFSRKHKGKGKRSHKG